MPQCPAPPQASGSSSVLVVGTECGCARCWALSAVVRACRLLMTGIMSLLVHSSLDQLAAGLTVTMGVLLHLVHVQPYSNMMVNHMQAASLVVQSVTLLFGLIQFRSEQTGEDQSQALAVIVLLLNIMIFAIPPVAVFYEEGYQIRRIIKRNCCCW